MVQQSDIIETSRGAVPGRSTFHRFGFNPAVGTTEEDLWYGSTTYPWPTSALALRVRSGGNAADTAAGAGARTITVIGLDSSFNEVTEVLTLAGASASAATSTAFIRLTRAYVETCGTYTGTNTGTIILETTGGTALGYLAAGKSQTQLSMYTVPAGYTAYLRRIRVSGDSSKATTLNLWQRRNADTVAAPFKAKRLVQTWSTIIDSVSTTYEVARSFPAKTDLWATAFVGTGSGFAGINMDILLVKD